jgi:hypothetical protein
MTAVKILVRKKRPKPTLKDVTHDDIRLLARAHSLPTDAFMTYGRSYFRLESLGLIGDDCKITLAGRMFLWRFSQGEAM